MKYDVYFHNDFDGRASAAVMRAFLRSRGDDIEHYVPVDFDLREQWGDERFFAKHKLFRGQRNPAIVVDFFYHPKAAFWFDHHETTFKKETWRSHFTQGKSHVLAPKRLSCCHLVYASLKKNFGWKPSHHFTELVRWLDVVDGATYTSAKQVIEMKEPALQVDAFIDATRDSKATAKWMVKLLSEKSLRHIAGLPRIKKVAARSRMENKKALGYYEKNLKLFGKVTFIDLTGARVPASRYAPYRLFPNIPYAMRVSVKGGLYRVRIGANPWRKQKGALHIGRLLQRYGGGGHKGAGGVEFKTRSEAERAIQKFIGILNRTK